MADYNTFIIVDTKTRKPILTTSSARKAARILSTGYRMEVWNDNKLTDLFYAKDKTQKESPLTKYLAAEKEYIRKKQAAAEERNRKYRYYGTKI